MAHQGKKTKGSSRAHGELVKVVLVTLGSTPYARVWSNNTGRGLALDGSGRVLHFGSKGSADIIGITCDGKFLSVEVKTGKATQTPQQRKFQTMIGKMGGRYYVVRSAEEATYVLKILKEELCQQKK